MSLLSENPYKRLFIYQNTFDFDGKEYSEHFYYLIKAVEKPHRLIESITILKISFIEEYLKSNTKILEELKIVAPNIPEQILENAGQFLELQNLGRY